MLEKEGRVPLEVPSSTTCQTGRRADRFTSGNLALRKTVLEDVRRVTPKKKKKFKEIQAKEKERKPTIVSSRELKINTIKQIS